MHSIQLGHHASTAYWQHAYCRSCVKLQLQLSSGRPRAAAGDSSPTIDTDSLISLPVFPLPTVLHPAQTGTLLVFEPRYLELFRNLQASTPAGSEARFGHILAPSTAPPFLMQQSIGGLPPLGVCAAVKLIETLSNGHLQVHYQGLRRFKLLTVDRDTQPYPLAAATWLDDDPATDPMQQQLIDTLELDVFSLLKQVAKYSEELAASTSTPAQDSTSTSTNSTSTSDAGSTGSSKRNDAGSTSSSSSSRHKVQALPDAVFTYAPPPPTKRSVAEYLIKAGVPAGGRIATWQRMGSVYEGDTPGKKKPAQDPYQMLRDQMGKERRQELFSFAAASVLELGLPERVALLQCRDTAARLQFVAAAVQPHLQDLVARVSVRQALVNSS